MHQLRVPLILVGVGLVLTALDVGLAKAMGGTLSLGPARLRWIAVGIVAIGMIVAFQSIEAAGEVEATLVAGGIKIALLTTAFGLAIAIPVRVAKRGANAPSLTRRREKASNPETSSRTPRRTRPRCR